MEEEQFERLLDLFPVVRSRSYCADDVPGATSRNQRLNHVEEPLPLGPPSLRLQQHPPGYDLYSATTFRGSHALAKACKCVGNRIQFTTLLTRMWLSRLSDDHIEKLRVMPHVTILGDYNVNSWISVSSWMEQVDGTGSPSHETEIDKGTSCLPTSLASLGEGASFWDLLRAAAEQQFDHHEVQQFCDAFKSLHEELVNKALSLDAIERIAKHWPLRAK